MTKTGHEINHLNVISIGLAIISLPIIPGLYLTNELRKVNKNNDFEQIMGKVIRQEIKAEGKSKGMTHFVMKSSSGKCISVKVPGEIKFSKKSIYAVKKISLFDTVVSVELVS